MSPENKGGLVMANKLLKDLALSARNRLINRQNGKLKNKKVFSPNVKFKIISNEDAEFNERASALGEEDMLSPLAKLINYDYFAKLSKENKERYLWDVVEKYKKFREKAQEDQEQKLLS